MSVRRGRKTGRLRWLPIAALGVMLVVAAPAPAAPQSLHGGAYQVMKEFMQKWDKDGFAKVVDLGGIKTYRVRLAQARIVIDPNIRELAEYRPDTNTVAFKSDPRKVKGGAREAMGMRAWHEVTHALEDTHGDDFSNTDKLFQERHTEYMTNVATAVLPVLDQLERRAKAGATVAQLRDLWKLYLEKMDKAIKLPETQKYPPDLTQMRTWFGFSADPEEVKDLYLSGKALPGRQGANLRTMLAQLAVDWSGEWESYTFTPIRFTQVGDAVTGDSSQWDVHWSGTANGSTLAGTGEYTTPGTPSETYGYAFQITMSEDGQTFSGHLTQVSVNGVPVQKGPEAWVGWRSGHTPLRPPAGR